MVNIGTCSIDIHKNERDYSILSLSDINVVKYLIQYRDKVHMYYKAETDNNFNVAGNVKNFNQELIVLYTCLDELILKAQKYMTNFQINLIELISIGYTFKDMEQLFKQDNLKARNYKSQFNTICKMIVEENDKKWSVYIHKNYLKTEFKQCKKCRQLLPRTKRFFVIDSRLKEGLKNHCKRCI